MNTQKLLCVIISLFISLSFYSINASAEGAKSNNDVSFVESQIDDDLDGMLIVIRDENGNIVETHRQTRQIYVNGTQYSIPARGSLTTYQYQPSNSFFAGFCFSHPQISGTATTRNRSVTIQIRNSASIGGARYSVCSNTYSTNQEDNTSNSDYMNGNPAAGIFGVCHTVYSNSARPYYDAVYYNNSSNSMTISLFVGID